jgi:S-adenosylmethionine hydrolase
MDRGPVHVRPSGLITLLTDFGTRDAYAGVMKGVIATINPRARTIDLSHDVAPQDIDEAAWLLRGAYRFFPAGTVHVAVVDPGVGSERRAIAVQAQDWWFVGPDNGVLSAALDLEGARTVELRNGAYWLREVSRTFHGRDVFAPVAAHLSAGAPFEALGPAIDDALAVPASQPALRADSITAHVVHIDRFGNAVTDLDAATLRGWAGARTVSIEAGGRRVHGVVATYAEVGRGEPLAVFGSSEHLEVAVREGDAAAALGLRRGDVVVVRRA